jgi:transposase
MSRRERADRHRAIVAAYELGGTSRSVASQFRVSSGFVRDIIKLYGVSRPVGRPLSHGGRDAGQ